MNSKTQYRIIAVLICIVIYVLYISLSVAMGWEHGGGFFVLVILVGILRAVWKGVTNLANEEDNTNETLPVPQEETLPEIPDDTEVEQLPVEEEIPIPVEEVEESIPQEESEDLPPIPDIEEDRTTIAAPTEEPEMFNQQPKTHWQKFRLYYTITIALCIVAAVAIPVTIHVHKQNKIEILLSEAIKACENTFFDLALQHLDKAYALDSKNYAVNYYIGCVHCHKHNYEPARKHLETAYKINKKKEDCVLPFDTIGYDRLLYYYYISLKDYQAFDNLSEINQRTLIAQEYLTRYPNECDAYRCMVYESFLDEEWEKGRNFFEQLLNLNPDIILLNEYTEDLRKTLVKIGFDYIFLDDNIDLYTRCLFDPGMAEWVYIRTKEKNYDVGSVEKIKRNIDDYIFPLDWIEKTHSSQQENNKTTTQNKSVEKTKAKPSNVHNGHKFVDLGLSVKWATANIGANKPEDYGDYFAWGEVTTKVDYLWSTYKWCNGDENELTKYNTIVENGVVDNKTVLERKDDAAFARWGGNWRIPTETEWQELIDYCAWTWTTINGIEGYKISSNISGYSQKSIFLPTTGWRAKGLNPYGTLFGVYWANSLKSVELNDKPKDSSWGSCISFSDGNIYIRGNKRSIGLPIRPVCP